MTGRIKSPSYAVLETYELEAGTISHFDFFRFNNPSEWEDAGFREIFADPGLKLCEWPEKAAGFLPDPELRIHISAQADDSRQVRVEALTPAGRALLQGLGGA